MARVTKRDGQWTASEEASTSASEDAIPEEYLENVANVMRQTLDELNDFLSAWNDKTRETSENVGEDGVLNQTATTATFSDRDDDPISLCGDPRENIRLEDICASENALLSKTTMILAHLGEEIQRLARIADETIYPLLTTFGERADGEDGMSDETLRKAFVDKLQPLQDSLLFMDQLRAVIFNLFTQLSVVYSTFAAYTPYQSVRLSWAFHMLGYALAIAAGIDEAVRSNKILGSALMNFKRTVLVLRGDPPQFGMNEVDVSSLDSALSIVDKQLFASSFFSDVMSQLGETEQPDRFIKELAGVTLERIESTSLRVHTKAERLGDKHTLLSCLCLTILHSRLVPDMPDRKLCCRAWDVHKLFMLLPVATSISLCPAALLDAHLSPTSREFGPHNGLDSVVAIRREMLNALDQTFPPKLGGMILETASWLAKFTASPNVSPSLARTMNARVTLFKQGFVLAERMRHYVQEIIYLHVSLDAPVTKRRIRLIGQGVEMLQAVHDAFTGHVNLHLETQHLLKYMLDRILRVMVPARALMENAIASAPTSGGWGRLQAHITAGKGESNKQDALANMHIAVYVLSGPATQKRMNVFRMCLDSIQGSGVLSAQDVSDVAELVELVDTMSSYRKSIEHLCDTSFLFFVRELFPAILSGIYANASEAGRLPLLINCFRCCETLLMRGGANKEQMMAFESYIEECLNRELIQPLCRDIETDLRLHLHSARIEGIAEVNPLKNGVRDLSFFTKLPAIRMLNYKIDIRNRVQDYLNRTFHNHTAIALHNWKSYTEMRNLAIEKYSLQLSEIELPSQTLEQGLDVLELMRNIHVFVSRYTYNLNTQCFVEKPSAALDRKHLNTISIRHVANSIRTHGTGITHTTINFAYQYLAQRFQIFNQFLFDDHIRSQLMKEARMVHAETKEKSDAIKLNSKRAGYLSSTIDDKFEYPVDRALRLMRDIRKLGVTEDGASFIDQFRALVTEMGNALGFVRMVRLGTMHYTTNAAKFVPSAHVKTPTQSQSFEADGLSDVTKRALKNLEIELEALSTNGAEGTDYFQVLVSVFSAELKGEGNAHLKDFYLILPALTMSAAENMLAAKEKLNRRGKESQTATFTDDGFSLGIAYLLSVLGQHDAFDALQWFASTKQYFDDEEKRAEGEANAGSYGILGRSSEETLKLKAKLARIAALREEFVHLKHSLIGSKTFVHF